MELIPNRLLTLEIPTPRPWKTMSPNHGIHGYPSSQTRARHIAMRESPREGGLAWRHRILRLLDALLVPGDPRGIVLACGFLAAAALGLWAAILGDPIGYAYLAVARQLSGSWSQSAARLPLSAAILRPGSNLGSDLYWLLSPRSRHVQSGNQTWPSHRPTTPAAEPVTTRKPSSTEIPQLRFEPLWSPAWLTGQAWQAAL